MTTHFKTKADMRGALQGLAPSTTALGERKPGLSASDIQASLSSQVGHLDLGLLGNLKATWHRRREQAQMQQTLTSVQVKHATQLMVEKVEGECDILRMAFRKDFSDRIAHLAEAASVSQITVLRKLKAIESEARRFTFHDLKAEMDALSQMLAQGVIDETDFQSEAAHQFARYEELKNQFTRLMDGYAEVVGSAYQGGRA